jgi:TPR repeat protein
LLQAAARAGHSSALQLMSRLQNGERPRLSEVMSGLAPSRDIDARAVLAIAASHALQDRDLGRAASCLSATLDLTPSLSPELAELVTRCARLAEDTGGVLAHIGPQVIEPSLDMLAARGDGNAAYLLGRALCGIACGPLAPEQLVVGMNMRKGAALLLRAADAGQYAAWLHLHRLHSEPRSSVANSQLARFFLEKAAVHGSTEAQRRLGAMMLRSASSLSESELAIHWLHQATSQGDEYARELLRSLVLPLVGTDDEAMAAVEEVRRTDPWLSMRLLVSRRFGLTKLEALAVDPVQGLRSWGLVVGRNPFISQARLSAPRAVPALSQEALADLRRAAAFFEELHHGASGIEGDLRCRSLRQRRAFERHRIDESLFFAIAKSMTLEALRQGPKWAYRARQPLQMALAA